MTLPRAQPVNQSAILTIIVVCYMMIVLDISIVLTGLPQIHRQMGFTDAGLSWVSSAYTLTFGGFLLLGARAGDILGRRRMFETGLVIFAASSFMIGVARSPEWLVSARAVQGIGSAILAPSTLALLQTSFAPGAERTHAVSFYAAAGGISASVGLVIGGVLADWVSWRAGFFINLPVGAGLIWAGRRYIAETERHSGAFDLAGALASTIGMSALVFGFVNSAEAGWHDPLTLVALAGGATVLALFVAIEWRARQPIMPLRLFNNAERSAAYAARVLFLGANVGFFFFATLFMQGVLGLSAAMTGLAFLPAMVVNFVSALMAPRLNRRFGAPRVLTVSLLCSLVGIGWLSFVSADSTWLGGLALPMLLIGAGQGGTLGPLTVSGITGVDPRDAGAASGVVNAAHQLGSSLGLGVLVAAAAFGTGGLAGRELLAHQVAGAMRAGEVMIALALAIVIVVIVRRPHRAPEPLADAPPDPARAAPTLD